MIRNKVIESGIIPICLLDYKPNFDIIPFDIKSYLYMGLVVKEKDFRDAMDDIDWCDYQMKAVYIYMLFK
jgi:hypothetical protein